MIGMLTEFLTENKLKAKLIEFKKPVTSAADAAKQLKVTLNEIGKSILFMTGDEPVLVVLLGSQRASEEKIKAVLGCHELEMATAEEVLEMTGFEVGGVPPIGIYGVKTLIQKEVADAPKIWCGGGDELTLIEISGAEIVEFADEPVIVDVAE